MAAHTISPGMTGTFSLVGGDTLAVLSGGTAVNTVVGPGAADTIAPGGTDRGGTVSGALAIQFVNGSAAATAIVSGGEQFVGSAGVGGVASNATILQGGVQLVDPTGSAVGTTLSGGAQYEFSGGAVTGTTVDDGGTLIFGGGTLSDTTVNSGGTLELMLDRNGTSGQFAGTNAVRAGGTVAAGGAVAGILQTGFVVTNNTPIAGISGGVASGVTFAVLSLGVANGLTVGSGGVEAVSSGGVARATVIASGGFEFVFSGGEAITTTIEAGASETISAGGSATGAAISGGMLTVAADGTLAGTVTFTGTGGTLVISGGSGPPAVISGFASGNTIDLADLSATTASYANGTLGVLSGGATVASLNLAGSYSPSDFTLSPDSSSGTEITIGPPSSTTTPSSGTTTPLPNDLDGNGQSDALMTGTTGALVLDDLSGGQEGYTQIGALGPEWQVEGEGAIAGDGKDQFVLWYGTDDSPIYGALVLGEDDGGAASYTAAGAIGPQWQFEGIGPIAGGSTSDLLLW